MKKKEQALAEILSKEIFKCQFYDRLELERIIYKQLIKLNSTK